MDGIYTDDTVTLGKPNTTMTIRADTGARPIFVHSDGKPPAVDRRANTTVIGLWFGGTRPADGTGAKTAVNGAGGGFTDCTFFGYISGLINGSDAHGNIYRRNRFVRCGYGLLNHPLYVANLNSSQQSDGVLSEENIIVGCEGYSVHYYHEPSYGLAQYNFMGDCLYGLAIQGDLVGPSANRNIVWTCTNAPLYHSAPGTCDHNVWRGCSQPNPGTLGGAKTFDTNYFVSPVPTAGTNPVTWQEADVVSNLGNSSANIDAAISALETAFGQTVQQIHDDATIETHFATLKAVIDTWKLQ